MNRILFLAAALAAAAPAGAQRYYPPPPPQYAPPPPVLPYAEPAGGYGEDIVVYSPQRRLPDDVESLSQRVGYRDLDLYYADDRRELRRRVSLTARDLCDRLGEPDSSGSILPSCRDAATRDALRRVGTPAETWAPRDTAWIAPPRWRAPPPPPVRWVPPPPRHCGCGF